MSRLQGNSLKDFIAYRFSYRNSTASLARFSRKTNHRRKLFLIAIVLFVFHSIVSSASSREKTDVIYMQNGDKITCEIRSLEKGQLTVKPDYTDSTIVIDWTKVGHVESRQDFVVTDPRGEQYSGSIAEAPQARLLAVVSASPVTLPHESVIQIEPLGETFLRRLRGNIDLGLSLARSNAQKNLTLQGGLTYQSKEHLFSFDSDSQFTSQEKTSNTNETTVKTALYQQLRKSNWYGGVLANFLSSSEQQIALRSTLGVGLATRPIFTNRTNLNIIGGLGYTIENDAANTTSTARTKALDSAFAVQYSTFRFDSTTFDTTLWLYPSLTSPGRIRMTLNQDVYYKFLGDFYVRVSFYDNYDNQPVVGAPSNNLGGSTSLGWSFH
jgi:Protein of unknown function, DUF481